MNPVFRVTYVPTVDRPPVVLVEAPSAHEAAAEVYPDADHTAAVRVEMIRITDETAIRGVVEATDVTIASSGGPPDSAASSRSMDAP
jgi:hypothetical protein